MRLTPAPDVLVTGTSHGFGQLITARLVAQGWRVFATMRDQNSRPDLERAVADAGGDVSRLEVVELDVSDPAGLRRTVRRVLAMSGGSLEGVVANAGVLIAGAFEATPADAVRHVMEVNFFGAVETVRATLPALRAAQGRIVLISSDSGLVGTPGFAAYSASKFALEGWGESLADELRPLGVRLSIVEPGPFRTGIATAADFYRDTDNGPYSRLTTIAERSLEDLAARSPEPDPVVDAVLEAMSSARPRLRYPVGREARAISAARGILPEPVFRRLVRRLTSTSRW